MNYVTGNRSLDHFRSDESFWSYATETKSFQSGHEQKICKLLTDDSAVTEN